MVASRAQYCGRRNGPVCARQTCGPKELDLRFRVRVRPTGNQIGRPEQRWRRFAPRVIPFSKNTDTFRRNRHLAREQRAFRSLKTVMLKVRPIFHWRERRVRAHLFVCMLANYPEWHLWRLAPLLFAEEGEPEPAASPVAATQHRDRTRETLAGGLPLQRLPDLPASLSTLTAVELVYESVPGSAVPTLSAMTDLQRGGLRSAGPAAVPGPIPGEPAGSRCGAGTGTCLVTHGGSRIGRIRPRVDRIATRGGVTNPYKHAPFCTWSRVRRASIAQLVVGSCSG